MTITIIASSTRAHAASRQVANYLQAQLEVVDDVDVPLIDLFELALPVFDATSEGEWATRWQAVSDQLEASDAFVFVTPEWDGMVSVGLLNMFHCVKKELAHKPVYPVAVSSGRGGRYPLAQLRQLGYKNKQFVLIPESLFIDQVGDNLVDGQVHNQHTATRATYGLALLREYAAALKTIRASGAIDHEQFGNGL